MLDAWPRRAADGCAIAHAPNAAAGVLRWAVVDRDRRVAPLWDAERQLLMVGDVRLYNRRVLSSDLELKQADDDATDLELAWKAYRRWGEDAPRRLVGDFAFVVWDQRRRSIFAARDHTGVRPLYYRADGDGAFLASDVRQILAVTPRFASKIDAQTILEHLSFVGRTHGHTFFRDISALPPGHSLAITAGRCERWRYWVPSFGKQRRANRADRHAEIRSVLRQAVYDRLESDRPIVAHSSGGLDSSAIVMLADAIYASEPHRAKLVLASALARAMPCDDSHYMDAVARRVPFEGVRWDALGPNLADVEDPVLSHPGLRHGLGGGPKRDVELARERGARVLLSGFFGDGLTYAYGISGDMFRGRLWAALASYVRGAQGVRARARLLARSLVGVLPPPLAVRVLNRLENRSFRPPPSWMGPELRARCPLPPEELDLQEVNWPSHVACQWWAKLTSATTSAGTTFTVAYAAEDGIEVRLPYLDVRLLKTVLDIPWRERMPDGGDHRRLGREAILPLLPPEFAGRLGQGAWTPVWMLFARRLLPALERMLSDGTWLSAPYVDRSHARAMLTEVMARQDSVPPTLLFLVSEFGVLEAWLRRVFEYDAAARCENA